MVSAGPHAAGQPFSELANAGCLGEVPVAGIGIHCDKLDAVDCSRTMCDGITTGSAEPNYLDVCSDRYKI